MRISLISLFVPKQFITGEVYVETGNHNGQGNFVCGVSFGLVGGRTGGVKMGSAKLCEFRPERGNVSYNGGLERIHKPFSGLKMG